MKKNVSNLIIKSKINYFSTMMLPLLCVYSRSNGMNTSIIGCWCYHVYNTGYNRYL